MSYLERNIGTVAGAMAKEARERAVSQPTTAELAAALRRNLATNDPHRLAAAELLIEHQDGFWIGKAAFRRLAMDTGTAPGADNSAWIWWDKAREAFDAGEALYRALGTATEYQRSAGRGR